MQVKNNLVDDNTAKIEVIASLDEIKAIKDQAVSKLAESQSSVPGFRNGKAPLAVAEKYLDPSLLQNEFLESAVNQLYGAVIESEKLRPIEYPKVSINKFVPYTTLEFTIEVEVIGKIKLSDYKSIKLQKAESKVTAKEVNEVLETLKQRLADKKEVKRAAKDGDEVVIDFKGVEADSDKPVNGADGKSHPLILGSNAFIPGFEPELIGLKPGAEKTFKITFPKDYTVTALQNKKVNFTVKVNKVSELIEPKGDDAFAKKAGEFKTLNDLKADIKKQLESEAKSKVDREFENELVERITDLSEVKIPSKLVDDQLEKAETEERQNLTYRGQTWQEHLDAEGITEEEHRSRNRPMAEKQVKASLVLGEISDKENIQVSPEEIEIRLLIMKGQYQDPQMRNELDKPEAKESIANQLMAEKTLTKLTEYSEKANKKS